jgi:hypothetical protein
MPFPNGQYSDKIVEMLVAKMHAPTSTRLGALDHIHPFVRELNTDM